MKHLYIPTLTGILGPQGSGKSFAAIKVACQYADQIKWDLCFNFEIDIYALYKYCVKMQYDWLASRIYHNHCEQRSSKNLIEFMKKSETIYILDEAGVYLNCRKFKDLDEDFLHELAQCRHDGKALWWTAQYYEMSDKLLRSLSAGFIQCKGFLRFNRELNNSELYKQNIYLFSEPELYHIYLSKIHNKLQGIKAKINTSRLASYSWEGTLNQEDKLIFSIYKSFNYRVGDFSSKSKFKFSHKNQLISHNTKLLPPANKNNLEEKAIVKNPLSDI